MFLTVEVVNANGKVPGESRKTIGADGVQIGRAKENGWVIDDPYISRVHARIRSFNGAFYVEGVGRNPLSINDPTNFVSNHDPQLLRLGDRFFLDRFEFVIASAPELPAAIPQPSLNALDIKDALAANGGSLDPLVALGAGPAVPAVSAGTVNANPPSHAFDAHFHAPRPLPVEAAPMRIPETWNRTGFTSIEAHPAGLLAPSKPSAPPVRISQALSNEASAPSDSTAVAVLRQSSADADETRIAGIQAGAVAPRAAAWVATAAPAQSAANSAAPDLDEILRIVTKGVMEVLQSRAQTKSQLRISMTHIQPMENNPLKFSPNVQAALHAMLVERNDAYLPMARAFEEAFADIRHHQIAVLHGIRAAFEAMLEQFDPEALQAELEKLEKHSGRLLKIGATLRFKDFYTERFAQLSQDRDDSFRRLFQDHFTRAYEEQMATFKTSAFSDQKKKDA